MPSELRGISNPADPRTLASAIRDIAEFLGINRLRARVTAGDISAGTRRWTIQLVDRKGQAVRKSALMRVHVSTAGNGPPSGTQTAAWVNPDQVRFTYDVTKDWDVYTDQDGQAQVDIGGASGERFVHAAVHTDPQIGQGSY